MLLNLGQLNNLRTGVRLAAELSTTTINHRKFITVKGYSYNTAGRRVGLKNVLNDISLDDVFFEVRCYEISNDYYVNKWDVTEDDVVSVAYIDEIKGVKRLEEKIMRFVSDFSLLVPEWNCDNLL